MVYVWFFTRQWIIKQFVNEFMCLELSMNSIRVDGVQRRFREEEEIFLGLRVLNRVHLFGTPGRCFGWAITATCTRHESIAPKFWLKMKTPQYYCSRYPFIFLILRSPSYNIWEIRLPPSVLSLLFDYGMGT